jgi:PAS domain-containing protein
LLKPPTQKFRDIVEAAPQLLAVLSADIQGRLLYANDAFSRVLHLPPTGLLGR